MKTTVSIKYLFLTILAIGLTSCQESLEERCQRELAEYTKKNCPAYVDRFTVQDSVTYEPDTRTIHYYYTLSGNADNIDNLQGARNILINQLRNTTFLKAYKDDGFRFSYTYYSKSTGKKLVEHTFTEADYKRR